MKPLITKWVGQVIASLPDEFTTSDVVDAMVGRSMGQTKAQLVRYIRLFAVWVGEYKVCMAGGYGKQVGVWRKKGAVA